MTLGKITALACIAIAVAGCGSSVHSVTRTALKAKAVSAISPSALQACLEKKGYNVSTGLASVPATLGDLYAILTTALGSQQANIVVAIGGSPGQGNAAVEFFDSASAAQQTAAKIESTVQQTGEGPVQTGNKGDIAWYVWTNTANTNNDVLICASGSP
jgi:hypothetical protein